MPDFRYPSLDTFTSTYSRRNFVNAAETASAWQVLRGRFVPFAIFGRRAAPPLRKNSTYSLKNFIWLQFRDSPPQYFLETAHVNWPALRDVEA